ncbi:helix-turn-helix domain-containing protein [Pelagibacterium luteolum]|uniref:AraC-type DNA-binding protein n=1 Tax=Pelagibacterium luteolum TaxID=440168 RepID=A0A1G7SR25_9HYPH|nr:helix-turn-helix domain-containing protein [Pelagibacterium luteolum]SDG24869.1 AraC-type DNA-binding protein [Pelagibacterium luteolum]
MSQAGETDYSGGVIPAAMIRFCTSQVVPPERYPAFKIRINTMFDMDPDAERAPADFAGRITSTHTGQMLVSAMETETFRFERSRKRLMIDHLDHMMVRVDLDGPWDRGGAAHALTIIDLGQVTETADIACHNISLVVPRRALAESLPGMDRLHANRLTSPSALILADHIVSLMRHADGLDPDVVGALSDITPALIAACLRPQLRAEGLAQREFDIMMLERVRACLRANLYNPALDPDFLQKTAGVSRATLYRLFEPMGGVAAAIRTARLRQALRDIARTGPDAKIADISHALGFSSDAHFSRSFKAHFGCSPRDARTMMASGPPLPLTPALSGAQRRFPEWLNTL